MGYRSFSYKSISYFSFMCEDLTTLRPRYWYWKIPVNKPKYFYELILRSTGIECWKYVLSIISVKFYVQCIDCLQSATYLTREGIHKSTLVSSTATVRSLLCSGLSSEAYTLFLLKWMHQEAILDPTRGNTQSIYI